MAADIRTRLMLEQSRKRQRLSHVPKLLPNEQVEVRSVEDGFRGSWHRGTVIECRTQIRVVKYDHFLCDDGSDNLVEFVPVLFAVDGKIPANWQPSDFPNYRGKIRPVPPRVFHDEFCLHFGQYVDALYDYAWWEGVVFDHDDGSEVRLVFFPDLGYELRVLVENLRVTQDWDAATDEWKFRGDWTFLEIIEELKLELPVFVSLKQVWYEVRMTKCFVKEMKEWTCPVKERWKETVIEVMVDNFKLTMADFLHSFNFSEKQVLNSMISHEPSSLVVEEEFGVDLHSNPKAINGNLDFPTEDSNLTKTVDYFVVKPDIFPECCPDAILKYYEYFKSGRRPPVAITTKVRQHLSYLGWKIECKIRSKSKSNGNDSLRYHYTDPDGKQYYSLNVLCTQLNNHSSEGMSFDSSDVSRNLETSISSLKTPSKEEVQTHEYSSFEFGSTSESNGDSQIEIQEVEKDESLRTNHVKRSTKRARKEISPMYQTPRTVLSWLIDNNIVLPRAKVEYYCKKDGSRLQEGRVTRVGIKCNCCKRIFSLVKFQKHAGSNKGRPSANIFLEDGRSLLDCQLQLKLDQDSKKVKKKQHEIQESDYICSVCQYGGELVLCDQCPSTFHAACVGLKEVPDGDWFCPSCCCRICNQNRFSGSHEQNMNTNIINCVQCERQYHIGCLKRRENFSKLKSYLEAKWFCSLKCEEIFTGLQRLLGKPIPVGRDNLTWTLRKNKTSECCNHDSSDMEELIENYSKLNVAISVMHECFEPVKEALTGRDIVEDVIFCKRSELHRLNFKGFYTVLLEKDDELISTAVVRVYGEKLAEVPLVGTRFQYRRRGMCHILMQQLEKKLAELGVERLILPAVSSVLHTWTRSFGFSVMTKSEKQEVLGCTFLDFQGTTMCQKLLLAGFHSTKPSMSEGNDYVTREDFDRINAVLEESQVFNTRKCESNIKTGFLRCYQRRKFTPVKVEALYQK